ALAGVIAVISVMLLSGCQEASTLTRVQTAPFQKQSASSDKILTLAVFPDTETVTHTDRQDMYLVGTQSYADKLMSIYQDSNIPALPANASRLGHENPGCVPILMVTF
ncbi:MAG: hypothetical protein DRP56_01365, partial [Planctomycetota bacterium]